MWPTVFLQARPGGLDLWPRVVLHAWPDGRATGPTVFLWPGGLASASSETRLCPPFFAPHCVCALRVCAGPLQRRPNTPTSASQIRLRVEPARQVRPRRVEPARQIHPRRMEPAKIRHVHPRRVTPASASDVAPHRPHRHTHARERAGECGPVCPFRDRPARQVYLFQERPANERGTVRRRANERTNERTSDRGLVHLRVKPARLVHLRVKPASARDAADIASASDVARTWSLELVPQCMKVGRPRGLVGLGFPSVLPLLTPRVPDAPLDRAALFGNVSGRSGVLSAGGGGRWRLFYAFTSVQYRSRITPPPVLGGREWRLSSHARGQSVGSRTPRQPRRGGGRAGRCIAPRRLL